MKVIRFNEADSYEPEKDWKRLCLCNEKDISIEYFIKPPFHASPLHNHSNAQILVVLKGKLTIIIEEEGEETPEEPKEEPQEQPEEPETGGMADVTGAPVVSVGGRPVYKNIILGLMFLLVIGYGLFYIYGKNRGY